MINSEIQLPSIQSGTPISVAQSSESYVFSHVVSLYDESVESHGALILPTVDIIRSYGVELLAVVSDFKAVEPDNFFKTLQAFSAIIIHHNIPAIIYIKAPDIERLHNTLIFADFVRDPSLDNENGAAYTLKL